MGIPDRDLFNFFSPFLLALLAVTTPALAEDNQSTQLTMDALTNWLEAYADAWESRDPDKAAKLFSEDSSYRVTPYDEPHVGQDGVREYWASVTANQRNVQFEFQPLSVNGNTGIAHWSAVFDVEGTETRIELDGIFVLAFDRNGAVRQLHEWWHLKSETPDGG